MALHQVIQRLLLIGARIESLPPPREPQAPPALLPLIQAIADTHDFHESFGSREAYPKVWVSADDLPQARAWLETYERDKTAPIGD